MAKIIELGKENNQQFFRVGGNPEKQLVRIQFLEGKEGQTLDSMLLVNELELSPEAAMNMIAHLDAVLTALAEVQTKEVQS